MVGSTHFKKTGRKELAQCFVMLPVVGDLKALVPCKMEHFIAPLLFMDSSSFYVSETSRFWTGIGCKIGLCIEVLSGLFAACNAS